MFKPILSTLSLPFRRPFLTTTCVVSSLALSVYSFGPVATFGAISSVTAKASQGFKLASALVTGIQNEFTCRKIVAEVKRSGVTQRVAPDISRCANYFPAAPN